MVKEDCIFCKLANGVFPTATLAENEEFRVILDAGPAAKGHMLVIPKQHYADVFEIPEDAAGRAFALAKKMACKVNEVMECDGVNILQNNKEAAGQTVFHFHIHVIPRKKKDTVSMTWKPGTVEEEDKAELIEKLSVSLS